MLAVFITGRGRPDRVKIDLTPMPEMTEGQCLVKVHFAGINYADVVIRTGIYPDAPKFPFILGYEFSGVVERTYNAKKLIQGDRVIGITMFGGQAEYVCVDEAQLFKMPEAMSFEAAAALPVNFLTAYFALYRLGNLREAEKILIHSCAGGVGTAAVQLALIKNAEIFGTVSATEKAKFLEEIGVQHPLDYKQSDFRAEVRRLTEGAGVDLVLDPIGGPNFRKSYSLLKPGGRIICYGVADFFAGRRFGILGLLWKYLSMPRVRTLDLMQDNRGVHGLALNRLLQKAAEIREIMNRIIELHVEGRIRPVISKVFDFRRAPEAHAWLESGRSTGKLLLRFAGEGN